jgi:hypothetical protein
MNIHHLGPRPLDLPCHLHPELGIPLALLHHVSVSQGIQVVLDNGKVGNYRFLYLVLEVAGQGRELVPEPLPQGFEEILIAEASVDDRFASQVASTACCTVSA